jgi:hypothetical protein
MSESRFSSSTNLVGLVAPVSVSASASGETKLADYLALLKLELRLRGDPERRALSRVESDLREMASCYQELDPTLAYDRAMARALDEFGPPDELGRKLHAVYCPRLSPKEIGLLAIFPVALLPLLEASWGDFARQVERTGVTALGASAIMLTVGFFFAHRWRSPVQIVWGTALVGLLATALYALFRAILMPPELVALATNPAPLGKPQSIPAEQAATLEALLSWWGYIRFGFKLALTLFFVFLLLWLARREWTLSALAVFTFLAISPYRLYDTFIVLDYPKGQAPTATVTYTGQFLSLLNPIRIGRNEVMAHTAIFLGGGLLFAGLVAIYLSLSLSPARFPTKGLSLRLIPPFFRPLLDAFYARPRLTRCCILLAALVLCQLYQLLINLVYRHITLYPAALFAQTLLLAAFIFVPRSVVIMLEKMPTRRL